MQEYLESLAGYSLDRLSKEPVRLSVERRKIDAALEQLSVDNYRVHVDNHRAVLATRDVCTGMGVAVRTLRVEAEKELQSGQVAPALARASDVAATYQRYRRTLRQHAKLLELFEIPQLMARCVRVNAVPEALDLATFVIKMERLHTLRYAVEKERTHERGGGSEVSGAGVNGGAETLPQNISENSATVQKKRTDPANSTEALLTLLPQRGRGLTIISDIAQDVIHSLDVLYGNLSRRLSGSIHLTEALQVVGFLRRLKLVYASGEAAAHDVKRCRDEGSAATIRDDQPYPTDGIFAPAVSRSLSRPIHEIFLNCRERFFQREIDRIPSTEDPHHYLERLADVYRVHLYDLITQYQAIFDDVRGGVEARSNDGEGRDSSLTGEAKGVSASDMRAELLSTAVFSHVSFIIDRIRTYTPMIEDGSSLSNVVEQYMNLGHSLAKVGADFRPLLVGHFEAAMLGLALPAWNEAFLAFEGVFNTLDRESAGRGESSVLTPDSSRNKRKTSWERVGMALQSGNASEAEKGTEKKEEGFGRTEEVAVGINTDERQIADYHSRLLLFRPLAHLTNACIGGFNELRKCASMSVQERVRSALVELIGLVSKTIADSTGASSHILPGTGSTIRAELESLLRVEFVGTLAFCFRSVYPDADGCDDVDFVRAARLYENAEKVDPLVGEKNSGQGQGEQDCQKVTESVGSSEGEETVKSLLPEQYAGHSLVRGSLEK